MIGTIMNTYIRSSGFCRSLYAYGPQRSPHGSRKQPLSIGPALAARLRKKICPLCSMFLLDYLLSLRIVITNTEHTPIRCSTSLVCCRIPPFHPGAILILSQRDSRLSYSLMINRLGDCKCALIIAHPGHELRVHHWLETTKPVVLVLTDGSGSSQHSRLQSTTHLLQRAGARAGAIYGLFSDAEMYMALMNQEFAVFLELLERTANLLAQEEIDLVAGDAIEGYNPSHDICRYLINAALELVLRKTGRRIRNYDFPVVGSPRRQPGAGRAAPVEICLDDPAWQRKLEASEEYPELAAEVEKTLATLGQQALREECLYPVDAMADRAVHPDIPFYERHGEKRCQEGVYKNVIRYRQHVRPIAEALWHHAIGYWA